MKSFGQAITARRDDLTYRIPRIENYLEAIRPETDLAGELRRLHALYTELLATVEKHAARAETERRLAEMAP